MAAVNNVQKTSYRKVNVQPRSRHLLPGCLERNNRCPKSDADKGSQCTTQGVSDDPDVRVRVQIGDVIVEVHSDRIEQRFFDEAFLQAALVASVSSRMAIAHGSPGRPDFGATAGEEDVIVQFVFFNRRTAVSDEP